MNLSKEQVEHIRTLIDQSRLTIETLKEDLIDHLCCVVEYNVSQGKQFEISLQDAIDEVAPEGLYKIEQQTLFLLNQTKIIYMKKVMYAVGLGSTISITMGLLFKMLHLPASQELTIYGFLTFALFFVPMLTVDRIKVSLHKALSDRLRIIFGITSAAITGLGVLLKLFHLNGANISILVGTVIFSFGFLPFLFFNMYRKSVSGS
jgi:hypothetical protein